MNKVIIAVILCHVVFLPVRLYSIPSSSWDLQYVYETRVKWLVPNDLDGDGTDEILECIGVYVYIKSQQGDILQQLTFDTDKIFPLEAFDINHDGYNEPFFSITKGDSVFLCYSDGSGKKESFFIFEGRDVNKSGPSGYDGSIEAVSRCYINGDDHPDVLCSIASGFDLSPRGIIAYDVANKNVLWCYYIGSPPVGSITVCDMNDDGSDEIILGTHAPYNGVSENSVPDTNSWLCVLSNQGRLLWKKSIGDRATSVIHHCSDINNDGIMEIVACETGGLTTKDEPNHLYLLNALSGSVMRYVMSGDKFMGMKIVDYNRDGKIEIITGNSDGTLRIYDANLDVIADKNMSVGIDVCDVKDIDGNGTMEILLVSWDGRIVILDERLECLCSQRLSQGKVNSVITARAGRKHTIIARTFLGHENINSVLSVKTLMPVSFIKDKALIGLLLIIITVAALFVINDRIRYSRMKKLYWHMPLGVIIVSHRQRLLFYNKTVLDLIGQPEKLLQFVRHVMESAISQKIDKSNIGAVEYENHHYDVKVNAWSRGRLIMIRDMTAEVISRDILTWSSFAQRLAHEIKNPLSTVTLALQRIQSISRKGSGDNAAMIDKYIKMILDEVNRLRETTDKFMRILSLEKPNYGLNDMSFLLDRIISKYEGKISDSITITKQYGDSLPRVRCDPNQIAILISNIIDNAIQALEGQGSLTVRTSLTDRIERDSDDEKLVRYFEISIEDSGKGIPSESLGMLFKPQLSSKPGGSGFGLVIAKKIVDDHNGRIEVDSKLSIGTTVRVELPL